ncbi:MAG: efflux RND transporter periplasmic adaptor subunit [Hyphomicrobiaceae bacterium]|nr:efflux RND transporter periplasmic adaptor subunit [Hyphomicrobiaceae bacterium]
MPVKFSCLMAIHAGVIWTGVIWAGVILAGVIPAVPASAQQGPPQAIPVTVAPPLARRITQWDEYSGRFEAVETVEVRPRVSGFIDKVHFKDGQPVAAGDLLFTIDQRPFKIAVESADAEIARAKAQVALAENEVERARPLVRSGTVTERDFDQRGAALSVARAGLLAAEAAYRSVQLNLEWTEVRAPISGRISAREIDAGNLVTGGVAGSTLLTTIVSTDPVHFIFDASEADYLRYTRLFQSGSRPSSRDVQNPVRVKLADEDDFKHTGLMDFVDNRLSSRSGTIRGRAILENKNGLLVPGIFGRLQLFGGESDALLIPDTAVVSDQASKIVFVVAEGDVVKGVPVELGPIEEGLRVVRSGLKPGDRVVIDGLANPAVRPGAKVKPEPGTIKQAASN